MKAPFSLHILGVTARIYVEDSVYKYRFMYPAQRNGKFYRGTIGSQTIFNKDKISKFLYHKIKEIQEPIPQKETLTGLIELYMTRHAYKLSKEGTREISVFNLFKAFTGNKFVDEINLGHIEDYVAHRLKAELESSTINREMTVIKSLFNKGIKWNICQINPVSNWSKLKESPGRIRYLTQDEEKRLIFETAYNPKSKQWLYIAVILARNAGLRQGELLSLQWPDIDFVSRSIKIMNTKANRFESVPINQTVFDVLSKAIVRQGYVIQENNQPITLDRFKKVWKRVINACRIENLTFHDLRHDFASRLALQGHSIQVIKELLRHTTLRMSERYAHLTQDHLRKAIESICP